MSDDIDLGLLKRMIQDIFLPRYELPWHIEYDWTVEVWDATGKIVFKCMTTAEADRLIELSGQLKHENDEASKQIKELLGEDAEV